MSRKHPKVVFAEGCFDFFEGTQAELEAIVREVERLNDSGELCDSSEPLTYEEEQELLHILNNRKIKQ
jgi:hypothetical protein